MPRWPSACEPGRPSACSTPHPTACSWKAPRACCRDARSISCSRPASHGNRHRGSWCTAGLAASGEVRNCAIARASTVPGERTTQPRRASDNRGHELPTGRNSDRQAPAENQGETTTPLMASDLEDRNEHEPASKSHGRRPPESRPCRLEVVIAASSTTCCGGCRSTPGARAEAGHCRKRSRAPCGGSWERNGFGFAPSLATSPRALASRRSMAVSCECRCRSAGEGLRLDARGRADARPGVHRGSLAGRSPGGRRLGAGRRIRPEGRVAPAAGCTRTTVSATAPRPSSAAAWRCAGSASESSA